MEDLRMNLTRRWLFALVPALLVVGCTDGTAPKQGSGASVQATTPSVANDAEAEVRTALARLDPADRKLAEAQRYCAVVSNDRLGGMGPPYKLMVKGEPVFLCCDGCKKKALADPEKTLARVKELKAKTAAMVAP
jgi:hypothetical protein